MEFTLEWVWLFVQQRWLVIAAVLLLVIVLMKMLKTMLKWLLIGVLIVGLLGYAVNYINGLGMPDSHVQEAPESSLNGRG